MSGLVLAFVLAASPPAWCARAAERLAGDGAATTPGAAGGAGGVDAAETAARIEEVMSLWPAEANAVRERMRALAEQDVSITTRLAMMRLAVHASCHPSVGPEAPERLVPWSAKVEALMRGDPRFGGVRQGDDAVDRALHSLWLRLVRLLESEGMRQYAGGARVVYFVLLLGGILLVVWRLARVSRQPTRQEQLERPEHSHVLRRRAFASWRAQAAAALDAGDARGALCAGQAALLARVGERDRGAVNPAWTHREILTRVPRHIRHVVTEPFALFEAAFFGAPPSVENAQRFLGAEDDAEVRLTQDEAAVPFSTTVLPGRGAS